MMLALCLLSSCATRKLQPNLTYFGMQNKELFENIDKNELAYDWFSAKLNILSSFDGNENPKLGGQLRMKKDSVIWISASAGFGIEAFRLKITTDSVWFVNRLEKNYFCEAFSDFEARLGFHLSFDRLQSALVGNCLKGGDFDAQYSYLEHAKVEILDNQYRIAFDNTAFDDAQSIRLDDAWIEASNYRPSRITLQEAVGVMPIVIIAYDAFEVVEYQNIATVIKLLSIGNKTLEATVKYSGISLDGPLKFPLKISNKLEKVY
jgi:hypothetical protein